MLKSFSYVAIFIGVVKLVYVSASCSCGLNEVFDKCIAPCPPRRCDVDERLIRCSAPPQPGDPACKAGCRCADNFYRNDTEVCVPKNQCPQKCGENEIQTSCIEAICERRNCSDLGKPISCVRFDTRFCTAGCLCKEGYLKNDANGACVPIGQCPNIQCNADEVFDVCPSPCPGESCEVDPSVILCLPNPQPGDPDCNPGCRCRDNYFRNDYGYCVTRDQCPKKCGENEIPTSCIEAICERRNCSDLGKPISCVRYDTRFCTAGCLCKEGYLKNDANGACVPIGQCPMFDVCPSPCPGESCGVDPSITLCLPNPQPGDPDCNPGCRCRDNYFRNDYGYCVTRDQCPKKCGENEIQTSCIEAICERRNCSDLGKPISCVRYDTRFCTAGCLCKEGYLKNDANGACVPIGQCPTKCGLNEYFSCGSACGNVCATLTTQNKTNCPIVNKKCNPRCYCQEGYAHDDNNICIPIKKCPPLKCPGPNEFFSCGGACDNVCATLASQNQTNCPIVNIVCNPMCYCKEGYARDSYNTCIPISKCPPPVCGINEVFDVCPATCPPKTCDALERAYKCKAPPKPGDPECKPSCQCADDYYRNEQGVCVAKNECPLNCFGQNEVIGCEISCPPQTCESIGKKYECPLQSADAVCKPACICKKGYFRNIKGECISKENCLKCPGPNEFFSCGGACDNVCATLASQNQTNCPIVNIVCNPMCYCEEGYARDSYNTCIPISKCPPPKINITCGTDEVYDSCVNGGCGRWNCSQPGEICINLVQGACREGCHCKKGLLRSFDGTCIPADQCPTVCGINEVFDVCPATCPPKTCDALDRAYKCKAPPKPGDPECNPSCRCADDYYSNKQGVCVAKNECPPNCFGQNEVIGCQISCPPQTCESIGKKYSCPLQTVDAVCKPVCICKKDYFRNIKGECISKENCLKCPGPNEFFSCGGACDNVCATLASQNQTNCPIVNIVCNPMCYCKEGYARDSYNTCIPISKCPPPKVNITCGTDEVYDSCVNGGCGRWNCSQPGVICIDLVQGACREGCHCKKGLLRNVDGICIPADQCPNNNNNTNDGLKELEQGNVVFTLRFLYAAAKANPGVSLIISPFSVLFLLAQFVLYASGALLEQLLRLLNLDSKPEIRSVIPNYLDTLSAQTNITIDFAAKTYISELYELTSNFETDTRDIFKAEAQNLDFCKPDEAASIINAWVEQKTNNFIKNLVSPSSFNCDTVMALVNAIYLKGVWKNEFDPENTRLRDFYVDKDKTVQVNMMSRTGYYKYAEIKRLNTQVIELPYQNENFSFMICLPMTEDGINNLLDGLSDSEFSFDDMYNNLQSNNMNLQMPKFNISTTSDLKEFLMKDNNVPALFNNMDLSGLQDIVQSPEPLYVSSATQKATIIVDESGSEAAAGTAATVSATAIQQSIEFTANHPFVYFILYRATPLFCGIYFADV